MENGEASKNIEKNINKCLKLWKLLKIINRAVNANNELKADKNIFGKTCFC